MVNSFSAGVSRAGFFLDRQAGLGKRGNIPCGERASLVVSAKAGTYNHRQSLWRELVVAAEHTTQARGYGSRLKAGTTAKLGALLRRHLPWRRRRVGEVGGELGVAGLCLFHCL